MGKKNGALFSKALFGYKRKDVIEYIRSSDSSHADEIYRLNSEKELLQEKLNKEEVKSRELDDQLIKEKQLSQEKIKKLSAEYDKKIAELTGAVNSQKERLENSENRASSYLKLIDSSSSRAETAEAELAVLSAVLEECKSENADLRAKLSEKENEIKRNSDFEQLAKKLLENNSSKRQNDLSSLFSFFKKNRHKK